MEVLLGLFGTVIVTALTEWASRISTAVAIKLPPIAKKVLAFAISTALVGFGWIVVRTPLPDAVDKALTDLAVWWLSMILHDVASKVVPA